MGRCGRSRTARTQGAGADRITWVSLHLQFGQGFKRLRKFRETFVGVLASVHAQYSGAKFECDERGITLRCSPPPVKGRLAIALRPTTTVEQVTPPPAKVGDATLEPHAEAGVAWSKSNSVDLRGAVFETDDEGRTGLIFPNGASIWGLDAIAQAVRRARQIVVWKPDPK